MTRLFGPLATVGVACLLSAFSVVPADEPKAATPAPVGVTTEVLKTETLRKAVVRPEGTTTEVMTKAAAPVAAPKGFVLPEIALLPQVNVQQVQQQTNMFRTVLRVEYQFVLAVCEPTKYQRREIARAGERALTVAATQAAMWQGSPRRVVFRSGENQVDYVNQPDLRKVIRDALAAAVKTHLSAEQTARYLKEVESRAADEKRAAVLKLVEGLDQILLLSTEQRAKVADALSAGWDESWAPSLQSLMNHGNPYFSCQIPDRVLLPALSPSQARIWQTAPKTQQMSWRGYVPLMGADDKPLEDAGPDDPPGTAARAPESKP